METIVDRIRYLCQKHNTSITKIEVKLGYANGTIGKWRNGKRQPPLEKVIAIANLLDTTSQFLLTGEEELHPPAEEEADPNRKALYKVIDKMSAAELALLLERAERIIESRG